MKKIVIDARESGTSTGRYVDKLLEHLHILKPDFAHDLTITVLTKPHRLDFMAATVPGFTAIAAPFKEFTFAEQLGFKDQLDSLQADLVHFTMVQQPVRYRGRHVTTMHDLTTTRFRNPAKNPVIFTLKQQVYKWVNRRAANTSATILAPSEFVRQDVARFAGVSPDKIVVTHEAADELPSPAKPVAALEGGQFIMYVGRPTPHKNLERLIDAFALLRQDYPDLKLALAGKKDSNYQRIEALTAQRNIGGVIFTDFIDDQQLRWLYENCRAYAFPSLSEGFGLPAVEAMLHGAPVAASNATCLPEICGEAAIYFDPADTTAMAESIGKLLKDQSLRDTYIAKGREQAATYSWRRMAEQTLEVYRRVLGI